ncbi:uncharacterized protein LOC128615577 isoform X1 [Ictalurus furcatus]|uniref:uncharacterized protein LOC128615577 isoform X1 n=1 Tax=Ictalurus furcatus TaxID=66913 RepID=UPI00234FD035|nr:uncharacterized protein LOC128615577 isoform X1 [Ictalurus furcatus]
MKSADASPSCEPPAVTSSQAVMLPVRREAPAHWTKTSVTSAGGSTSSVGHFSPEDQLKEEFQKKVIKEEPEVDDYHSGKASSCVGRVTSVDQQNEVFHEKLVKDESNDGDYFCKATGGETSSCVGKNEGFQEKLVKDEPEDGGYLCTATKHARTSSCVVHLTLIDQQMEGFQEQPLKKEEPNEDDYLCKVRGRSKFNVELLVSLVSKHRELYDKRHSDYKNVDKRELLWQGIADQIGFDVEEVKVKWKSLRDTYTRKKRENDCRSGQAAKKKKQWKYMKVMEFLTTSTEFQSVHRNISENTKVDDQNDASESEPASSSSGASITSPAVMKSSARKRKRSDMLDFLENYLLSKDARKREKEERREQRREQKRELKKDDIYFFVHGLVPALKRLSPSKLSSVKLQIQQLLHDTEFGQSSFSQFSHKSPVSTHQVTPQTSTSYERYNFRIRTSDETTLKASH